MYFTFPKTFAFRQPFFDQVSLHFRYLWEVYEDSGPTRGI